MTGDTKQLDQLLQLIDEHIDLVHCETVDDRYRRSLAWNPTDRPPLVVQAEWGGSWSLPSPWNHFEHYADCEAFYDPILMMQNQLLERVVPGLILKDDNPLAIRNNHGTIQIAAMLGGMWNMHENDPPWIERWDSADTVRALLDRDEMPNLKSEVVELSAKALRFYSEKLAQFPKCSKVIQISMPDLQGPFDTAEQLWGNEIFIGMLDKPDLVSALMEKVAKTMLKAHEFYRPYAHDRLGPSANSQHGYNIPGRLLIRNDSSILVSPDNYKDLIAPHDSLILRTVGGGSLHFCGNGEHLVEPMLEIPDLKGLDFGQSEMMNLEHIYDLCRTRQVTITNYQPPREEIISGQTKRDYPTGVVLVYLTQDIDDAMEVAGKYYEL